MANYFVVNSKFKPYSFDEMLKPYALYNQAYKEQEAALDAAREKEFSADKLDQNLDSVAYNMYNNASNDLRAVSDELATKGLSTGLRGRIKSVARDYKTTMDALNEAQARLYAEQDRRAKLGPSYRYQQDNIRIGDFLNGATPNQESVSLDDVSKDVAFEFGARAKTISQDTWNKVLNQNGKVINGYYDVKTESGLKQAQLDTILALANPEEWNRYVASNPTITDEQKQQLQGFVDSIATEMDAVGYDKYSSDSKKDIWNAIVKGAHAGLGGEEHKYQIDRSYDPALAYRKSRDKIADQEKEEQRKKESGEIPFYTDPQGNKYFTDGVYTWKHDKDGKEIIPPTPKSKFYGDESQGVSRKDAEAFDRMQKDHIFPLYVQDNNNYWFWKKKDKRNIHEGGEGDWEGNGEPPVSLEEFGVTRTNKLREILAKYNKDYNTSITLEDVEIYHDWDLGKDEFKIVLKDGNTVIDTVSAEESSEETPPPTISRSERRAGDIPGF